MDMNIYLQNSSAFDFDNRSYKSHQDEKHPTPTSLIKKLNSLGSKVKDESLRQLVTPSKIMSCD